MIFSTIVSIKARDCNVYIKLYRIMYMSHFSETIERRYYMTRRRIKATHCYLYTIIDTENNDHNFDH